MIRNCLGLTTDDLKRDLFSRLDSFSLSHILGLNCAGGTPGETAISNFDSFNIFTAKKALDYLNTADANNRHIQGDDLFGFLRDMMPGILNEFAKRQCVGGNNPIDDMVSKYKPDPYVNMYPSGLTDAEKEKLLGLLKDTNFINDIRTQTGSGVGTGNPSFGGPGGAWSGGPNGAPGQGGDYSSGIGGQNGGSGSGTVPYIIVNDNDLSDSGSLTDKTDAIFGESILGRIPIDAVEKLNIDRATYTKCFKTIFEMDSMVVPDNPASKPVITHGKLANLRRLHRDVLMKIYRFYYGDESDGSCKMRIHGGLTSIKTAYTLLGSSLATHHTTGEACSFSLVSVSNDVIVEDIRSGRLQVDFGYCVLANGVFITLPLSFSDYEIRGVVMSSPTFDDTNILVDFV